MKNTPSMERRPRIGIYTLQSGSFSAIPHKKAMAGVSLTMAFLFVYQKNLTLWSASQFCGKDFSSQGDSDPSEYWLYFEGDEFSCGGKDSRKTV